MSDRDEEKVAVGTVSNAAENGAGSATKPKRSRRAKQREDEAPETVSEEAAEMVAEGAPVGDEDERQLGVENLPAETVEQETAELEKSYPEIAGDSDPAADDAPKAEATVGDAVIGTAARTSRRKRTPKTDEPRSASDPFKPGASNPSPDGKRLAYLLTDGTGSTRLWISELDGSSASSIELPFRPVFDEEGPQWSPDGSLIALTGSAPSEIGTAIWLAPVDGGDCILLADHRSSDEQPRWSPDGSLLAFVSKRHGRSSICVATPDGYGPVVQLTDGPTGQDDRNPCWEPNSQRIAFTRHMVEGDQSGDQIWTVSILTGEQKQATKKLANRSQLQWCPGKSQIAFITDEAEWLNVGVVNPDNSAGWNLASEAGDKSSPRYSPDGTRILYTRCVRGEVRLVERPTSGATADPLDPGMGVVSSPRWLPDKQVVYQFASPTEAPSFVVQEAKKDVERLYIAVTGGWTAEEWFVPPDHVEYEVSGGLKSGVLIYRDPREVEKVPAVVYLDAEPQHAKHYEFNSTIQALVQRGFAVIVPTLPGTPGYGKKLVSALKERAGTEAEISDLVDLANWTRGLEYVDGSKLYLVGEGYGGAMALLLAGARPGAADAVAVIDPVTDWDDELDQSDDDFAAWYLTYLGLPSANRGKSALRTPTTFAGVLDLPVLLVGTNRASIGRTVQLERFASVLDELEVAYSRVASENETSWETAEKVAAFLADPAGAAKVEPVAAVAEAPVADIEVAAEAAAPAAEVVAEPDVVVEEVETVDLEAVILEDQPAEVIVAEAVEDGIIAAEAPTNGSVVEVPATEVAEVVETETEEAVVAEEPVVEAEPEPKREPVLASSNIGRGMRTDEI
jgi:Tol biopolymer transport system component/pimeloyl-ACP methyl ester carboxylesterase